MPVEMRGKAGATASKAPAPAAAKGAEAGPAVPKKPKSQRANTDGSLDGRTVLVTGLAKDATKQQIYKRFKKIATIDLPALIFPVPDAGELTAQVTYATHKGARQAVEKLDTHVFKGTKLEVVLKTSSRAKRKAAVQVGDGDEAPAQASAGTNANKKYRLIVRNLPFTCTEGQLRKACLKFGALDEVNIIMDKVTNKPRGFAFVGYKKPFDAAKALAGLNGKTLGGAEKINQRKIAVDWTVNKNEFMKAKEEEKRTGKKAAVKVPDLEGADDGSDDDDGSSDAGSDSDDDESGSDDEDGAEVNSDSDLGEDVEDDSDDGEEDEDEDDAEDEDEEDSELEDEPEESRDVDQGRTLFIRNVSFDTTEDSLKECFETFGEVTLSKMVKDFETNRPRGTAFVQFKTRQEAAAAIKRAENMAVEPLECDGRPIQVSIAVDRKEANHLQRHNEKLRDTEVKKVKDTRNLKLLKEGKIMVGTDADGALSANDRLKRQNLEQESTAKSKNPNYSVSKVSNRHTPPHLTASCLVLFCLSLAVSF
jgi:nucleolar protein 4